MTVDVVDLRTFYGSALGRVARHFVGRNIIKLWPSLSGLSVLGIGYATPYLAQLDKRADRVAAFMPAAQGVVNWPSAGLTASALVEPTMLPLPDAAYDRVIVVHALETSEAAEELLGEIWRILTPGGRLILVVPNRRGAWARVDTTPFGHGQPYSRTQLRGLMRQTLFSPEAWQEALYVPPFNDRFLLRSSAAWEQVGTRLSLPFAGVHIVDATKQLYRTVSVRAARPRIRFAPAPALVPAPTPGATMAGPADIA